MTLSMLLLGSLEHGLSQYMMNTATQQELLERLEQRPLVQDKHSLWRLVRVSIMALGVPSILPLFDHILTTIFTTQQLRFY